MITDLSKIDHKMHTECNCSLRIKLIGDGCSVCNPELAEEYRLDAIEDMKMNTTEHLEKIKAKCREMVSAFPPCESTAGWRSTIAAIDALDDIEDQAADWMAGVIIAAWPEELL